MKKSVKSLQFMCLQAALLVFGTITIPHSAYANGAQNAPQTEAQPQLNMETLGLIGAEVQRAKEQATLGKGEYLKTAGMPDSNTQYDPNAVKALGLENVNLDLLSQSVQKIIQDNQPDVAAQLAQSTQLSPEAAPPTMSLEGLQTMAMPFLEKSGLSGMVGKYLPQTQNSGQTATSATPPVLPLDPTILGLNALSPDILAPLMQQVTTGAAGRGVGGNIASGIAKGIDCDSLLKQGIAMYVGGSDFAAGGNAGIDLPPEITNHVCTQIDKIVKSSGSPAAAGAGVQQYLGGGNLPVALYK